MDARRALWVAGVGFGLVATAARTRRAVLRESAPHLALAWQRDAARVLVEPTRFLNEGETSVIVMPDLPAGDCTTVALLGARGLGFHVRVTTADERETRIASQAGAVAIERCGVAPPKALLVTSDSGRGALEVTVARSARPLAPLRSVLPERAGGAWLPGPEPGPAPLLPPPDRRADTAEARARTDGASIEPRSVLAAAADGSGGTDATFGAGCHTLRLFAVDPRGGRPSLHGRLDLDAEALGQNDDRLLARDRSDAPDADLSMCVGEPTPTRVLFVGSPPGAPVLVAHFVWPLPTHLPGVWGNDVGARMARVLWARHVLSLPREPFLLTQGAAGATPVPVPLEPGACYLGVVAVTQGTARALGLRVRVGSRDAYDDRGVDGVGAAVAFCAGGADEATAVIEAHGAPQLAWGLALYRVQNGSWEGVP
jgi:hypothetical protein